MAWQDNFNSIYESELPITEDGAKYWKFSLEEHKAKGTLYMSARIYQKALKEGGYEGPTKSGFLLQVNSKEDVDKLQDAFNIFFNEVKTRL